MINISPGLNFSVPLYRIIKAPKKIPPAPSIFFRLFFSPKNGVIINVNMISDNNNMLVFAPEVLLAPIKNKE